MSTATRMSGESSMRVARGHATASAADEARHDGQEADTRLRVDLEKELAAARVSGWRMTGA